MTKVICNEQCDFIVRNLEACTALIDCYNQAKDKVPKWIYKQLKYAIESREENINTKIKSIDFDDEGEATWLYPDLPFYDYEKEVGIYFAVNNLEIFMNTEEDVADDYPVILFHLDMPEKDTGKKWFTYKENLLKKANLLSNKLTDRKYRNGYPPERSVDNHIISTNISQLINYDSIKSNHEDAIAKVADELVIFANFVIENDLLLPIPK